MNDNINAIFIYCQKIQTDIPQLIAETIGKVAPILKKECQNEKSSFIMAEC